MKKFAQICPISNSHRIHGTGIFTQIYHKNLPNVGKYIYIYICTIHGSYGIGLCVVHSHFLFDTFFDEPFRSRVIPNISWKNPSQLPLSKQGHQQRFVAS